MARDRKRDTATLTDRFALAFLSGVAALLLGLPFWAGLALLLARMDAGWHPPFAWVLGFAITMALLGFVLLENFVAHWISGFVRWVLDLWNLHSH